MTLVGEDALTRTGDTQELSMNKLGGMAGLCGTGGGVDEDVIGERFGALAGELNERQRRLWAAGEAGWAGRGGAAAVARGTGLALETIRTGIRELESGETLEPGRVRRRGGGRKPLAEIDPSLLSGLERLLEADTRGDPESPLRWTAKSVAAPRFGAG
jgi:hypothetical protein